MLFAGLRGLEGIGGSLTLLLNDGRRQVLFSVISYTMPWVHDESYFSTHLRME